MGEIVIKPGQSSDGVSLKEKVGDLEKEIKIMLDDCGASDVMQARALNEEWQLCQYELKRIQAKIEHLAPGGMQELREQAISLEREIIEMQSATPDIDKIDADEARWLSLASLIKDAETELERCRGRNESLRQHMLENSVKAQTLQKRIIQLNELNNSLL